MNKPNSSWRDKANRIIRELSLAAYRQANLQPNGRRYKQHRPYSIPEIARDLVECLNANDEQTAKVTFMRYELGLYDK